MPPGRAGRLRYLRRPHQCKHKHPASMVMMHAAVGEGCELAGLKRPTPLLAGS